MVPPGMGREHSPSGGLAVVSSLLFLLWPALVATSRPDLISDLRASSSSVAAGHRANLGARFAVVLQTALALAVLVAALLLGRTLERLQSVPFGYAVDQLIAADVEYPSSLQAPEQQAAFYNRVVARLEALPDVSAASVVLDLPYSGSRGWDTFYSTEGQTPAQAAANPSPDYQVVLPNYFTALGITILRGRAIEEQDRKRTVPVVVISDALARRAWPGQDPIGKRINCRPRGSECSVVVGVARDTRYRDLRSARPVIYVPWGQASSLQLPVIVARGRNERLPALSEMRRAIGEVDPRVVVTKVSPVGDALSSVLTRPRFNFLIVSAFASIALLLSAFGTYAILSAFVRQQMPELGIRSALGAAPGQIFRSVITRGLGLATVGLVAGIVISLGLSRLLSSLLYEVSSVDPLTLGASVVGMLAIAILACWRPAKAATNIDPLRVLRME